MTKEEYINYVLELLNESGMTKRDFFEIEGADNSEVVSHIMAVFREAWMKALSIVPHSWANVASFSEKPYDAGDGSGYVSIPDDWYLLYCFKMRGWKKEVFEAAEEGDEVAKLQYGTFSRGTVFNPICVRGYNNTGLRILRYFSLPKGVEHQVEKALYIPLIPSLEQLTENADLHLDGRLEKIIGYMAASLVTLRFENYNAVKAYEKEAILLSKDFILTSENKQV